MNNTLRFFFCLGGLNNFCQGEAILYVEVECMLILVIISYYAKKKFDNVAITDVDPMIMGRLQVES